MKQHVPPLNIKNRCAGHFSKRLMEYQMVRHKTFQSWKLERITEILQCMQMEVLHPVQVSPLYRPETFIKLS